MIVNSLAFGVALLALQASTGTNIPGTTSTSPVSTGSGAVTTVVNGGDRVQADRDARAFAAYRANHPEMSYEDAYTSFSWGGGVLP